MIALCVATALSVAGFGVAAFVNHTHRRIQVNLLKKANVVSSIIFLLSVVDLLFSWRSERTLPRTSLFSFSAALTYFFAFFGVEHVLSFVKDEEEVKGSVGGVPSVDLLTVVGTVILTAMLPLVGTCVGVSTLWEALDRGFMGRPLTGVTMRMARWLIRVTERPLSYLVRHPADGFFVLCVFVSGVLVPALFAYNFWVVQTAGFSLRAAFLYNLFRIGPYFMNFAYTYTLCHKEGHSVRGIFKPGVPSLFLGNVFNWWIGLFYGVLPSTFAYGHTRNHHKYNNERLDIISTADRPRDSVLYFVRYIPRFALYAINYSATVQFLAEGNMPYVFKMVAGTAWYLAFLGASIYASPMFAVAFVLYPLMENILLLSVVNWCWHAFNDELDLDNDFVSSVTILDGPINVLNEDYHVVHHQYPGVHWTRHPDLYKKHGDEYVQKQATIFRDTHVFELFFLIILREYTKMAEKFVDLSGTLTLEQKEELIKGRLRACTWGPLSVHQKGTRTHPKDQKRD